MDPVSPAPVPGVKRDGHPSAAVPGPAAPAELRLGQAVTFPSSEGHPLCTLLLDDPTMSCGPRWPIGAWRQCSHTLLCSAPKATWLRKPPHQRASRPGLPLRWCSLQITSNCPITPFGATRASHPNHWPGSDQLLLLCDNSTPMLTSSFPQQSPSCT